jgi:hypothetical protein
MLDNLAEKNSLCQDNFSTGPLGGQYRIGGNMKTIAFLLTAILLALVTPLYAGETVVPKSTPAESPFLPEPTPESIPSSECSKEAPCNALIFQLELDGRPITMGDFSEEECSALLEQVKPGVLVSNPEAELKCVGYDVKREIS